MRWYICVTGGAKRSDGPERRPLDGVREHGTTTSAQRPPPTEAREGCSYVLALWATRPHAQDTKSGSEKVVCNHN